MKKVLFAAALVLVTNLGFSQMDSSMVNRRLERMKTDLSLTAEQSTKIRAIMMESWREGQKIRNANTDNPEAGRDAMMKQREASDKKIEAVLTAEQKVKYEKMREERRQRMQQGPPR
jgi:Spy/CpxP family protein refolding chaperone